MEREADLIARTDAGERYEEEIGQPGSCQLHCGTPEALDQSHIKVLARPGTLAPQFRLGGLDPIAEPAAHLEVRAAVGSGQRLQRA